jgi:O-antigen/teichoic acid export membrane protein
MIAIPFSNAIYPRLTQLVEEKNFTEIIILYHKYCQVLAVLLLPLGILIAFFSKEIITIWTGDPIVALKTYQSASVLIMGSILMGLMMIPYTLQLAFAWTKLGLYLNMISAITLIPSMIWLVSIYGTIGACFVWVALYSMQFIIMIHLMHKRILKDEKWKWYIDDIIKPFFASLVIIAFGRIMVDEIISMPILLVVLSCLLLFATCASAASAPIVRRTIYIKILNIKEGKQKIIV